MDAATSLVDRLITSLEERLSCDIGVLEACSHLVPGRCPNDAAAERSAGTLVDLLGGKLLSDVRSDAT